MVQSDQLRSEFAKRLRKAAADAHIQEWGIGARLAEITKKTPKAASKWLNGESMPGRANMLLIAQALKVSVEWLQYGEPHAAESNTAPSQDHLDSRPQIGGSSGRAYQTQKYENAPPERRELADELADKVLDLPPEEAELLKKLMERFITHEPTKT